jgi:repressor LexA
MLYEFFVTWYCIDKGTFLGDIVKILLLYMVVNLMNENQTKVIARNIKKLLNQHGMTQTELAEKVGIAKSTISDYMNFRAKPSAGVLEKIARVFDVSKADIDTTYKNAYAEIVDDKLQLVNETNELTNQYLSNQSKKNNMIPILGKIAAGQPLEAIEDIVDYIHPTYDIKHPEEIFGLLVNGESMNKIAPNGNYAVLRKQQEVENGEIAAVIVNGNYATLKKVYKFTDLIVLEPHSFDESYRDQKYTKENCDDIKIIGKFLYCVSPLINN